MDAETQRDEQRESSKNIREMEWRDDISKKQRGQEAEEAGGGAGGS